MVDLTQSPKPDGPADPATLSARQCRRPVRIPHVIGLPNDVLGRLGFWVWKIRDPNGVPSTHGLSECSPERCGHRAWLPDSHIGDFAPPSALVVAEVGGSQLAPVGQ